MTYPDFFAALKPARAHRRVMMHAVDHGYDGDLVLGHVECAKCGYDGSWKIFETESDCRRGVPCPKCNPAAESAG